MKYIIKLLLILTFLPAVAFSTSKVYVLCYHSFYGIKAGTDIKATRFKKQMILLKNLGYNFVSLEDIVDNKINGNLNILLTIDDGNRSVRKVFPFLKEQEIKPVLFIYPAIISRQKYALTYTDLIKYKADATIGGHGWYHEKINQKLYNISHKRFFREIYNPKKTLDKKLNLNIKAFAYPYGVFSDITIKHLKKAGYKYAFGLTQKPMLLPLTKNKNIHNLPRYMVTKSSWQWIYSILKKNALANGVVIAKNSVQKPTATSKKKSRRVWKSIRLNDVGSIPDVNITLLKSKSTNITSTNEFYDMELIQALHIDSIEIDEYKYTNIIRFRMM